MFLLKKLPFVLCCAILIACSKAPVQGGISTLKTKAIDSSMAFSLLEKVDSTRRTLRFLFVTDRIYDCSNSGIDFALIRTPDQIKITFKRIILYDPIFDCISGSSHCSINLGELANGKYDLTFEVNGRVSTAKL